MTNLQVELELRVQGADFHGKGLPRLFSAERWHPTSHYVRNGIAKDTLQRSLSRQSVIVNGKRYYNSRRKTLRRSIDISHCGPPRLQCVVTSSEQNGKPFIYPPICDATYRKTRISNGRHRSFKQPTSSLAHARTITSCLTREFHTWSNIWYSRQRNRRA